MLYRIALILLIVPAAVAAILSIFLEGLWDGARWVATGKPPDGPWRIASRIDVFMQDLAKAGRR